VAVVVDLNYRWRGWPARCSSCLPDPRTRSSVDRKATILCSPCDGETAPQPVEWPPACRAGSRPRLEGTPVPDNTPTRPSAQSPRIGPNRRNDWQIDRAWHTGTHPGLRQPLLADGPHLTPPSRLWRPPTVVQQLDPAVWRAKIGRHRIKRWSIIFHVEDPCPGLSTGSAGSSTAPIPTFSPLPTTAPPSSGREGSSSGPANSTKTPWRRPPHLRRRPPADPRQRGRPRDRPSCAGRTRAGPRTRPGHLRPAPPHPRRRPPRHPSIGAQPRC
jgi:hypothetical protein